MQAHLQPQAHSKRCISDVPVDCAGWLVLCKVLFRKGLVQEGFKQVSNGAAEGWIPDSSLFAEMLAVHALQGKTAAVEDILGVMNAVGVEPSVEHFNQVVISNVRAEGAQLRSLSK
jgi:hypothetical protein